MNHCRMIAEAPRPSVAVIEDMDFADCIGAFWGEMGSRVQEGFGMSGVLTNRMMRDLGDPAPDFPVVAGFDTASTAFETARA